VRQFSPPVSEYDFTRNFSDTRVILCPADEGKPVAMTEAHHVRNFSCRSRCSLIGKQGRCSCGGNQTTAYDGVVANDRLFRGLKVDGCPPEYAKVRKITTSCPDRVLNLLHSLGDLRYKRFGVTPEPEVRTKLLNGSWFLLHKWKHFVNPASRC